ncbi:MAG: hypothetical protein EOM72_11690 [Opitutae bacterium]|nr:hypothetical protein [Opitutae bacterium]
MKKRKPFSRASVVKEASAALEAVAPMTVRQVYYRLVTAGVVPNTRSAYQFTSRALVEARRTGKIPWNKIEDRLRMPRTPAMWADLSDYVSDTIFCYRRDVWQTQPRLVEAWLEKDALSGIFEDVLARYGVTLNVGRGFDGWASIYNAAMRYKASGKPVSILYFGDFDPSGEDMARSLAERLGSLGAVPELVKCALSRADIDRYRLPPMMAKKSDTRAAAFIEKHGDVSVELDALPTDVLRARLVAEVEARMDMTALAECRKLEEAERRELMRKLGEAE